MQGADHSPEGKSMKRLLSPFAALLCAALFLPATGHADEASVDEQIETLLGPASDYKELFYAFKVGLEEGKSDIVVSLVNYPITVRIEGSEETYASEVELLAAYDDVFTDAIMEAVANQDYGDLFVNSEGVMIGNGEVWITGVCDDSACTTALPRIMTIQSGN
jgi:hypothetical protein